MSASIVSEHESSPGSLRLYLDSSDGCKEYARPAAVGLHEWIEKSQNRLLKKRPETLMRHQESATATADYWIKKAEME